MLATHAGARQCEGIGLVVPGMVDHEHRPRAERTAARLAKRGHSRTARGGDSAFRCTSRTRRSPARSRSMWLGQRGATVPTDFVYVTVSDGVGAGVVVNGQVVRGQTNSAGEFGHVPLTADGPTCLCGGHGCLEAYTSNLATLSRYLGQRLLAGDGTRAAPLVRRDDRRGGEPCDRRRGTRDGGVAGHGAAPRCRARRDHQDAEPERRSSSAARSPRRGINSSRQSALSSESARSPTLPRPLRSSRSWRRRTPACAVARRWCRPRSSRHRSSRRASGSREQARDDAHADAPMAVRRIRLLRVYYSGGSPGRADTRYLGCLVCWTR